jgi:phytoene dehydrogenase-like protein
MKWQGEMFDVTVLGSGLGGLIVAALLASCNYRVLCLKERSYHPSYSREGYRFTPFSNFSEKRLKLELLKAIFQALNLPLPIQEQRPEREDEAKRDRIKKKVTFQVILPKARIDLFLKRPMLRREWEREFPGETAQIENFYTELDMGQHLLERLKTKEGSWSILPLHPFSLMKRWFSFKSLPARRMDERLSLFSREFQKFIQLQLISWCNLSSEGFPVSLGSYLLLDHAGETGSSNIELEKVERNVFEKYIQSGGKMEEIEGVERVDVGWRKKRRFTLRLKGEERSIGTRFLILNSPLHRLSPLLHKKEKLLSRWREKIRPRYILLPLFLGIDEKVVPVGMKDLLVSILDLEKPYEGGNLLFLSVSREGDLTAAPEGKRALTVESLIPMEKLERNSLDEHSSHVMRHLHHLFPFMEKYIEFRDWSWADSQRLGWSYPHFVYETTSNFRWREGIVPLRIWRGLYFLGKENFPYMGLEGEILGGWRVGQEILQKYQ